MCHIAIINGSHYASCSKLAQKIRVCDTALINESLTIRAVR